MLTCGNCSRNKVESGSKMGRAERRLKGEEEYRPSGQGAFLQGDPARGLVHSRFSDRTGEGDGEMGERGAGGGGGPHQNYLIK